VVVQAVATNNAACNAHCLAVGFGNRCFGVVESVIGVTAR